MCFFQLRLNAYDLTSCMQHNHSGPIRYFPFGINFCNSHVNTNQQSADLVQLGTDADKVRKVRAGTSLFSQFSLSL